MPQLTLEYTDNIDQELDFADLFSRMHRALSEIGGLRIGNCKSRAVKLDQYYIGDGEPGGAFVHVDVRFLEGRSLEVKRKIGQQLLNILVEVYRPIMDKCDLQITVEIQDIERALYFKTPEGTLTNQS